jgi:Cu2+-exporting ATPase/Cu+-exporting ATPase
MAQPLETAELPRERLIEAGACAHCGLRTASGDLYCCFGCELASRIHREAKEDHARLFNTLTFALVLSMVVMMLALFLYAEDVYDASSEREMMWMRDAYRVASWVLCTPVLILAGVPVLRRAWSRLRESRLSMEALIALGAFAAYGLSVWNLIEGRRGVYFDSASTALVLATLGRYLEAKARTRASQVLAPLVQESARPVIVRQTDHPDREVAPAEIAPGMRLYVPVDRVVPVDLVLEDGPRDVSLGVITGESSPSRVDRGAVVPAGAVVISEGLVGTALRSARDSTLERLSQLARSMNEHPSRLIAYADAFAAALTPIVALIALGTLAYWSSRLGIAAGVVNGLAVVLAACPCSYAIATPLVHWLALRTALSKGILIRNAEVLERIADVQGIAFDKTGTLTDADLAVERFWLQDGASRDEVLSLISALEADSRHPIARALVRFAARGPAEIRERRFIVGLGVEAKDAEGRALRLAKDGERVVLRRDDRELASFELGERVRPEADEALRSLEALGIETVMLTGDHADRAARVAMKLAIEARPGLSPENKLEELAAFGERAAMVGDGVNDAPALARAHTSFAIQGATDLARGIAHVTLLEPDLRLIPRSIATARHAVSSAKRLLILSTAYNLVFILLAACGRLLPVWAGLSMLASSLFTLAFAGGLFAEERSA